MFVVAAVAAVLASIVIPAGSAQACATCGTPNGNGYTVQAAVTFSGDAVRGGAGTVTIGVPATCWWAPEDQVGVTPALNSTDPSTWLAWFDAMSNTTITFVPARVALGERSTWEAAVKAAQSGQKIQLYRANCATNAPKCAQTTFAGGRAIAPPPGWGNCGLTALYHFYPQGNPAPPMIDPEQLAILARDHMDITDPQVERNPQIASLGQATLVGLPTYFWVTNPVAVGGVGGTRSVTAQVGRVSATVVARTDGLSILAPGDGVMCSPGQALQAYSAGHAGGCSLTFRKASVGYAGGYPVEASTTWTATWIGTGRPTPQPIDGPVGGQATFAVPVAEAQAITTGTG